MVARLPAVVEPLTEAALAHRLPSQYLPQLRVIAKQPTDPNGGL